MYVPDKDWGYPECDNEVYREMPTCIDTLKKYIEIGTARNKIDAENASDVSALQLAKSDKGKLQLTLVPTQIVKDIAEVREYGVKKYGEFENWRSVEKERYFNAMYRHWLEFLNDPTSIDAESGIAHYKHCACNMAFICEMMKGKNN